MNKVSEKTFIPIGLAVLTIGGGAFWLSALFSQVQFMKDDMTEMRADIRVLAGMKTDIEVIKSKVEHMESPVFHTRYDVKRVKQVIEAQNAGPLNQPSSALRMYNHGPFSMKE